RNRDLMFFRSENKLPSESHKPRPVTPVSRRMLIKSMASGVAAAATIGLATDVSAGCPADDAPQTPGVTGNDPSVRYCLNTSTIRGQRLTVPEQIELVASTGYDAIEPWIGDLRSYAENAPLSDLKEQLDDSGISIASAIGFANWIVDDPGKRNEALQQARSDMELLAELGATRIAAPPAGAQNSEGLDLSRIAERYHDLLEVGRETGVTPQLELWGFSKTLSRLGELAYVAAECGHPDAAVLPDVYHIYKGGSDFAGLGMIEASRINVFHMNDYPGEPSREEIGDADRVYPGDGVAPLDEILNTLFDGGFSGFLSLELFNRTYWELPAVEVAETGLQKMKDAVASATAVRNQG
ncbi:MAG: sugar phosphate isomerase/epimerase family protein, partial [Pseudomonadota bacterium]